MTASFYRYLRALLVCGFVVIAGLLVTSAIALAQDVSGLVTVTKSERSVTDLKTKLVTTTANITIKNSSTSVIGIPLHAVFDVSSASVQVLDAIAPGTGNPYSKYFVDLSSKVATGNLQPAGSVTFSVRLVCPSTIRYTYNVITYGAVGKATPAITWPAPAAITYGTALSATQLNATASVPGSFVYTPTTGTVLTAGAQILKVDFNPTDTTKYAAASATVGLTVNKAIPTITWAPPASIISGTPLSSTQLNATASVVGSFVYTPASGTVLPAGTQPLKVDFTPTNITNYNSVSATVTITVSQATKITPTIAWSTPAAITYGTALSATQLNATASVPGSFIYTPVAGTVLTAGTQTLRVAFTPTNTTNFTTASATVNIVVTKAPPAVTWATPAAIVYGAALSATQLNATSLVSGSFVYTPSVGAQLSAGTQALKVDFTPADTTNYATASATVNIIVNKATPTIGWSLPGAITYGTTLSATQLNASALTPGSFIFTPAIGVQLSVGIQSLKADFTPTDTTNYTTASATVNIVVTKASPAITWADPAAIVFGTALSSTQLNATSTVSGNFTYTPVAGTQLSAGNHTLKADFTPTDTTNYTTASATANIVVTKATPTVTWATPAAIVYGAALSTTQLNATASVPGTFVYTPATGALLAAGIQSLKVDFTPTDTTNYANASATINILVNKAIPAITWATPAAIAYGATLSAAQLNATASVPGSFVYTPAAGTVLSAGDQILKVDFTPTDTINYITATDTVSITVNKILPTITWGVPAAIGHGTSLTADQLNAAASVPGSFVYTPVAGTLLATGSQTLRVDFTPTDGTNYTTATATVSITVNKITPIIAWGAPAAIDFGTPLSVLQLNATASVTGSFLYTPASGELLSAGQHTLNVIFTPDNAADYTTASYAVSLTVNGSSGVNQAPRANAGPDQTVTLSGAQTSLDVTLNGTQSADPDGNVATYTWTGIPSPNPGNAASPKVTLYPGIYKYTLVVTDDKGAQSTPSVVTITVKQTLNPPVLTVSPGYSYSVDQGNTVSFNASASQIDGNVVSISALPFIKNATFSSTPGSQAAGTFNFSPDSTQAGIQMVTFTARNQLGLTDTKSVRIVINKVNHAPVIVMATTASVDVGKQLSIKATTSDPDGDLLTLTAPNLPANALFVPSTGTITFAPDTTQVGQKAFTVTASDGKLSTSAVVTVTVNSVQTGGTTGPGRLILTVEPVASLSLQPAQNITGSVNAPDQPVIPQIQSTLIVGLSPATAEQGSQTLTIALTGQTAGSFSTHFENGVSQANFGTGITVNSFVVTSATSATATISIDSGAALGSRAINVVTGNETAVSLLGFNVLKGITSITGRLLDAETKQGISGANVTIDGTSISAATGIDGSFVLFNMPAGLESLTLNATDHELITLPVNAPVGTTVNLGDITTRSTVFNPSAAPSATLGSVFGRGGAEFSTAGRSKEDIKKVVIDAILMTGGKSAGVLDEFGNQLNPNIIGNGLISLKASGVEMVADRMIRGETLTVGDYLYGFPLLFNWQTQPTLLRALSALQDVVDQAWANPNDPLSALTITLFNRGRSTLFSAPRLSPETPLNAIQAYLMTSTLLAWANNDIYYMNGSDQPSPMLMIGSRERARTLLAFYEGGVTSDAGSPILLADGATPPFASATADRLDIVLTPGTNNNNKEVEVTLDGSISYAFNSAQITKYQWRPQSSTDPTPPDGPNSTATIKLTSGAHHTYSLTVTDSNFQRSANTANVTINISGDCSFTTRSDQSIYPWCSTFQSFREGGKVLTTADPVATKVDNILKAMQPVLLANGSAINAANNSLAAFATQLGLPGLLTSPDLKVNYAQNSANAKSIDLLKSFTTGAAEIVKGQLDAFVGAVADKLFGYMIDKLTDEIIKTSRPAPPFLRTAKLVPQGSSAVAQQVKLTFMPCPDEKSDFSKASGGTLNGLRKYSYLIYRQDMKSGELQRIDIIPGTHLYSKVTPEGTLADYEWVDSNPPVGTNSYKVVARVIRTEGPVPPSVDTTDQKMLLDYMIGLIPGGGVLNSAFTVVDIADKILRGLFLQDSDFSNPEHIYVGDLTQNLHPTLDLAVDKRSGTAYLSIPETSGIFKVMPWGLETFVDAGFKAPYQGGLAVDSNGSLYTDNKASDDSYGGRIFSFQAGTGARQLAGSTTYYSQMLMYAKPANVATLTYGVDSQGECIYIADAMDQTIKRLAINTGQSTDRNVGQIYAHSSDLFFQSTTKMASGLSGKLFLTQGPDLMQIKGATVTKVFPDLSKNPFSWLTGVDVDQAGNLYLADQVLGTITMVPPPYTTFMDQDAAYRKRFVVMSGLAAPQDLKLAADGNGIITVDGMGIHKKNFGISGRIWDITEDAPLAGATLLVDNALAPGKTDADGFFALPDISFPQGPREVKLTVVGKDGRTQVIANIHLNASGHTALLEDLTFNPPTIPKLSPIPPPGDPNVTVDPDPLPLETQPFTLGSSFLGQTQTRHFIVPDRRIFPANSANPPPKPPPSSVSDSLDFAPAPLDKPTVPASSAPSIVQPVVTIVSPGDGMLTAAGSVTVTGMVESTENISSVTMAVNGIDRQLVVTNGVFTDTVFLNDGLNLISARAGNVVYDTTNNISFLEGISVPVKVQKGAAVSPSLDFTGVISRADGTAYKPYVDLIVTLYGKIEATSGYRIIASASVRGDGLYQFHLENGSTAPAVVQSLFLQLGKGNSVLMKVVVSDPRS